MVTLAQYQKTAVEKSVTRINELLSAHANDSGTPRRFLLQAPTGSGKTIMTAMTLNEVAGFRDRDVAFIFLAPNKLQDQAQKSFEVLLAGKNITFLTDLPAAQALPKNSILFLNWASINKKANNLIKEREDGKNLSTVIDLTKGANREVVLVIDESHHTATSKASKELINLINPALIFEVSATPARIPTAADVDATVAHMVKVPLTDVINEGVIMKSARFNDGLTEHSAAYREFVGEEGVNSNHRSIYAALREQEKYDEALRAEGYPFAPLMGIQLPSEAKADKDTAGELGLVEETISFLQRCGVAREQIAVYLSDRKENLENIADLHSPVRVVIFKMAVAVGWDCPRLTVGALLRDTKTKPFAIQTLGRWMRQPLRKHMEQDYLNHAYFYTESELLPTVSSDNEVDAVLPVTVKLREEFTGLDAFKVTLPSWERVNVAEAELTPVFIRNQLWAEIGNGHLGDLLRPAWGPIPSDFFHSLGFTPEAAAQRAMREVKSYVVHDTDLGDSTEMTTTQVLINTEEAETIFSAMMAGKLTSFTPNSTANMIEVITRTIATVSGINPSDVARIIVTSNTLMALFEGLAQRIAQAYRTNNPERFTEDEVVREVEWQAPEAFEVALTAASTGLEETPEGSAYAYDHLPVLSFSPEQAYLAATEVDGYKENHQLVIKNGDKGTGNLAIPYDKPVAAGSSDTVRRLFYPDWIVYNADGSVELHETKSGMHLTSDETLAKQKAADTYCEQVRENTGLQVRFHVVRYEEHPVGVTLYKSVPGAVTLDKDALGSWTPLIP